MEDHNLFAISPLDGRYHHICEALGKIFGEANLIQQRCIIEIKWLQFMLTIPELKLGDASLTPKLELLIQQIDYHKIKEIEKTTHHDVKAVEIYLQQELTKNPQLAHLIPWVHFGCTSEDINNLAYAKMWQQALNQIIIPGYQEIVNTLSNLALTWQDITILSHTHGQPASPTTLGKEINVFAERLKSCLSQTRFKKIYGKFSGAVGNFNAHMVAYPQLDWPKIAKSFVTQLDLTYNPITTQIEPHDQLAAHCHDLVNMNTILSDCCTDIWHYISLGYLGQATTSGQVGSSTMPHKINPINFENAEGNFGLATALAHYFARKLPISRLQRDLSDSTVLRNLGCMLGYTQVAFHNLNQGLRKITPNQQNIDASFTNNWQVLTEAIQTILRTQGHADAYEKLRTNSQGQNLDQAGYLALVTKLNNRASQALTQLTPKTYCGLAQELSKPPTTEE